MLTDRIRQFISINVTGRVFMLCTSEGIKSPLEIRKYEQHVRDILENEAENGADIKSLEKRLKEELEEIKRQIRGETLEAPDVNLDSYKLSVDSDEELLTFDDGIEDTDVELGDIENLLDSIGQEQIPAESVETETPTTEEEPVIEEKPPEAKRKESGYKPEAMAMQEKLVVERKPLAELLEKECVQHYLLTQKRAKQWVHNMSGRRKEEVEAEIVSEIAQNLHENVKKHIRKNKKNNPWPTPRLQEDLRMDISCARSVRAVIMLSTQINREIEKYQAHSKPGIMKRLFKK